MQNLHHYDFRCLTISRELLEIPGNRPDFVHFTHNSGTLCDIHIYDSRCLTISRELSEIPANQAKFAPFTHKSRKLCEFCTKIHPHLVHCFQISDHRQRTSGNWSESTRFHAVAHSSHKLHEIC